MIIDWKKIKHIHFVGIKGVAMTALAVWAKGAGFSVTGSDVTDIFPTDEVLAKAHIVVHDGFDSDYIQKKKPDLVIYTGAHEGRENVEVAAAEAADIPAFAHGRALGEIMKNKRQIAVAGSHGKTTTTAMIACILASAGQDPSYAVGCGEIFGLGPPGRFGRSDWFVAEADEYVTDPHHDMTPRFLWQKPEILVVTNIDFDHPDVYASLEDVQKAFFQLSQLQQGIRITVVNSDDAPSRLLMQNNRNEIMTYGFSPKAGYFISHVGFGEKRTFFTLYEKGMLIGDFSLKVPGRHNAANAAAAAAATRSIGLSWDAIRKGLLAFGGTRRRFEEIGKAQGIVVYDDYAHHPREIQATLAAARAWYPKKRIISIFQPHTYSRTKALLTDFTGSFRSSDVVVISDIYASAREKDTLGITSRDLVRSLETRQGNVQYQKNYKAVSAFLKKEALSGDVILFMGAGDISGWGKQFVSDWLH